MSTYRQAPWMVVLAWSLLACTLLSFSTALAQTTDVEWQVSGSGDWNVDPNWEAETGNMFVPESQFHELAIINNGGTAVVSGEVPTVGGVEIGPGTVEVESGGVLTAVSTQFATGAAEINNNGSLIVHPGGAFTAESLQSGGSGLLSATGNASLTSNGNSTLIGRTSITGPDVQFSTSGNLTLGGTYEANITGNTHSALAAGQSAQLGGNLHVNFQGVTPALGDSWMLVDAANIGGGFNNIVTDVPLEPGQRMVVNVSDGGTNGRVAELAFGNVLTLLVDRDSGAVSIQNPAAGDAISFDAYAIHSSVGSLSPTGWNSLEDQMQAEWLEANPSSTTLSEVLPTFGSYTTVGEADQLDLGHAFGFEPAEFGTDLEDLTFQYSDSNGQTVEGEVIYTGTRFNNLVLQIDPNDGSARLRNTSPFDIEIDVYAIHSDSGALLPDDWSSFEDQGQGTWLEANPSEGLLAEVLPDGVQAINSGQEFELGTIFDTAGAQDVTFDFAFPGEAEPLDGMVVYAPLEPPVGDLPGDYNGNGQVEQADLNLVLLNWGDSFETLPDDWVNERPTDGIIDQVELNGVLLNWGNTAAAGLAAAGSVPEPGTCVLLALAGLAAGITIRR